MRIIYFTAKLLLIDFTNSSIEQAFTKGHLITKKKKGKRGRCSSTNLKPPLQVPATQSERQKTCSLITTLRMHAHPSMSLLIPTIMWKVIANLCMRFDFLRDAS